MNFDISDRLIDLTKKQNFDVEQQPAPFTSDYYKDLTREKNEIFNAFQANNFNYIRNLPNQFNHKVILEKKTEKVEQRKQMQNELQTKNNEKKMVKLIGGGYFDQFKYQCDYYEWAKLDAKQQQHEHKEKMKSISLFDFRPSDVKKKEKYEDPFTYYDPIQLKNCNKRQISEQKAKNYIFPFHLTEDTFDSYRENKMRQRIIDEAKMLADDWKPAQQLNSLNKISKMNIQECIKELEYVLMTDWEKSKFFIGVNQYDQIEIIFQIEKFTAPMYTVYMNNIINDERITQFCLMKAIENWSIENIEKQTVLFTLNPPWRKNRLYNTFYKLHPEMHRNSEPIIKKRINSNFD